MSLTAIYKKATQFHAFNAILCTTALQCLVWFVALHICQACFKFVPFPAQKESGHVQRANFKATVSHVFG